MGRRPQRNARRSQHIIVVDTSIWISHLRGNGHLPRVQRLHYALGREPIVVGDLIMLEILQGAVNEKQATEIERLLRDFDIVRMLDEQIAVRAARNYRLLRTRGVTVRKTIDMVIGTYCIEHSLPLLHDDRDFDSMEQLGLVTVQPLPSNIVGGASAS